MMLCIDVSPICGGLSLDVGEFVPEQLLDLMLQQFRRRRQENDLQQCRGDDFRTVSISGHGGDLVESAAAGNQHERQ